MAEAAEAQAARHLAYIAEQGTAAAGNASGGGNPTRERRLRLGFSIYLGMVLIRGWIVIGTGRVYD